MKKVKFILLVLVIFSLGVPLGSVHADAAPPMNPPGGDVSPEGDTQVQMVAEQVIFDFRQSSDDSARVSAWFLFHNTSNTDENLQVRFPMNGDQQYKADPVSGEYVPYFPLIQNFAASVNGQRLPAKVVIDSDPNAPAFFLDANGKMYWSEFPVDFPAGKDVKLSVNYTFQPTEDYSYAEVFYILATGAGWKGPIGKADIIFRFPYILNDINVFDYNELAGGVLTYWGQTMTVVENEIRLHWDELEPTSADNVRFDILQPRIWQEILRRRIQVIGSPQDAGAWEALASAYASAGEGKHSMFGNPKLATLYIAACEQALTLDPNNIDFHFEFAQNMLWAGMFTENHYYQAIAENELATVLQLDPTNAKALNFFNENKDYFSLSLFTPGPFPTPNIPTFTPYSFTEPTPTPTLVPTNTITLTCTPLPTLTSTPMPTATLAQPPQEPVKNISWLIVIVGILLAAGSFAGGWVVRATRK